MVRLGHFLAIIDLQVVYNSKLNRFCSNLFCYNLFFIFRVGVVDYVLIIRVWFTGLNSYSCHTGDLFINNVTQRVTIVTDVCVSMCICMCMCCCCMKNGCGHCLKVY